MFAMIFAHGTLRGPQIHIDKSYNSLICTLIYNEGSHHLPLKTPLKTFETLLFLYIKITLMGIACNKKEIVSSLSEMFQNHKELQ